MKAVASVFHFADRSPLRRKRGVNIDAIQVVDVPLPPVERDLGSFIGRGQGPWQRKARAMSVGQSIIVENRLAHCFKSACTRLGYRVAWRSLDNGQVQVQIVSKPKEAPPCC